MCDVPGWFLLPELVFPPDPVVVAIVKSELVANFEVSRSKKSKPSIREALPHLPQRRRPAVVDVAAQVRFLGIHGVDPRLIEAERSAQPQQVPRLDEVPVALVHGVVVHFFAQIVLC